MKKLIMCQGLPGSGKSTWAEEQRLAAFQPTGDRDLKDIPIVIVVNKDSIRRDLEAKGWKWSREGERDVTAERDIRIINAFTQHAEVTVISDDTNLAREHQTRLREIATIMGATFETKRFDLPVEECVRRARARTTQPQVPERAIREMAKRYGMGVPAEYPPAAPLPRYAADGGSLPSALLCDLDGTLSLLNGRNPYDASTCADDLCNAPVRTLLEVYYRFLSYDIIYLSGREDKYRPQTETFMRKHHCPPGRIFMRPSGDYRKDWVVKGELFDAHVRGQFDVKFVLDDRNQVVDYWRHLGLTCFQVAEGNF